MICDLFHSISDPVIQGRSLGTGQVLANFLDQAALAESLGADTIWCAESHFSSETQKKTKVATIPHFQGEVGINCDSFQIAQLLFSRTKKVSFGSAIHNIVGGSGGPIASADRVNFLTCLNDTVGGWNRKLRIGVAAGRFPYQNSPFQIEPKSEEEKRLWPLTKRYVFIEALEIFLRLLGGEELNSDQIKKWEINSNESSGPVSVRKFWEFETIRLVPAVKKSENLEVVLGSHDPLALDWGLKFWDLSLFNLSFTSPEQIEALHIQMKEKCQQTQRLWHRSRLPRTVMVFIDKKREKAYQLANHVLDNYIEAMRGTTQVPDKTILLQRALVGDPSEICDQMKPGGSRGFHFDDRLMLWFEFNQLNNDDIKDQMKMFYTEVLPKV